MSFVYRADGKKLLQISKKTGEKQIVTEFKNPDFLKKVADNATYFSKANEDKMAKTKIWKEMLRKKYTVRDINQRNG